MSQFVPDAELHDWSIYMVGDGVRVSGLIHNDKYERRPDGTRVYTSPVVSLANGELQTRNTKYLLVNKAAEIPLEQAA